MPRRHLSLRLSLAAFVLLLLGLRTEVLAKSYAIAVETDPLGAEVYLDDKDGKLLGESPYRGRLPAGEYTLFIRKRGYEQMFQTIVVKKKNRGRQEFYFELAQVEYGRVEVVGVEGADDIDGGKVLIDGEEVGTAPDTIDDVPVGPHQVEVLKEGYEIFEAWIEVERDEAVVVEVELAEDPDAFYGDDDDDDFDDDDDDFDDDDFDDDDDDDDPLADDGDDEGDLVANAAPQPKGRRPYAIVALGPELGTRSFDYVVPAGVMNAPNLRAYDTALVPLVRLRAQIYPLAASKNPLLSGLGFSGSYALAKAVVAQDETQTVEGGWSEWDANLRFVYDLGKSYIGAELGYAGQTFTFTSVEGTGTLLDEVPGVDYRFMRAGLVGGFRFTSAMDGWLSVNYKLVSSLGDLQTKFEQTEVTAYGGQAGVNYRLSETLQGQLLLNLGRYEHIFEFGDQAQAAGTDQFLGAMLGIAYLL